MFFLGMTGSGWLIDRYVVTPVSHSEQEKLSPNETSEVLLSDAQFLLPEVSKVKISLIPPSYTSMSATVQDTLPIRAPENSRIKWEIELSDSTVQLILETANGEAKNLNRQGDLYSTSIQLTQSGFYNFKMVDDQGRSKVSELYRMEMIKDVPPQIEVKGLSDYYSFQHHETKDINFTAVLSDDYGLSKAQIVATLTKGSGEAVKFREEKWMLTEHPVKGKKRVSVTKNINLDSLNMAPGDELYFYMTIQDNKQPSVQTAKTETYFLQVQDTVDQLFSIAGSLGVDIMPEYFRSQRQIIIDTEQLIKEKRQITEDEFNSRSNSLAAEQKSLRLKYGQFMGVENESGIAIETEVMQEEMDSEDDEIMHEDMPEQRPDKEE